MTDRIIKVGIEGSAKGLVSAAKDGEKAVDGISGKARDAQGKFIGMGKAADTAGKEVEGLGNDSKAASREVDGLGRATERAARSTANLGKASHSLRTTGQVLALGSEKIVNQYTALAGGAGLGLAAKAQVDFNDELTQMGIAARDAQGKVQNKDFASWFASTKAEIMQVSKATGQGAEELMGGMRAIVQRTGDMGLATQSIKLMGETATASGSSVEEIGALIANLGKKADIKGVDQMRQAITLLLAQGKTGAFEMRDMVSNGERLFSVMNLFGKGGTTGLKSFGAFIQMARTSTGSAEQASTAIERLGSYMANTKMVEKHLAKAGIKVKLDKNADMETNIKKIITASKGDLKKLFASQAFGEEGIRALQTMANEYAAGNGFKMFDSFKEAGGDISKNAMLMDDFSTRTADSKMQLQKLTATLREFADKSLSGPLSGLTKMMSYFNGNAVLTDTLIRNITKSLLAMAAIAGSAKIYKTFQEFRNLIRSPTSGSSKGAAGMLSQVAGADVQRVYVVNMGGGGFSGGSEGPIPGVPETYGPARRPSAWNRWGKTAAIGAGIAGVGAAVAFAENGNSPEGWGRAMGSAAGVALGAFGGPLGMIIGQQIGDYVGLFVGSAFGDLAKDMETNRIKAKREDSMDVAGKGKTAALRRFMGASDATSNTQQLGREVVGSKAGARFMGYQKVNADGSPIALNVTTIVNKDGTSQSTVTGATDQVSVSHASKWFEEMTKPSLSPKWGPGFAR